MEVTKQQVISRKSSFKDSVSKCMNGGQSCRTHCGLCCVCHNFPSHSRTYYGRLFCIECFHKYIWSASKRECSGDIQKSTK